jgi:hypothetical protein
MENNINWYLGVELNRFSKKNKNDEIENIVFYNSHNKRLYMHFATSYDDKETGIKFEDFHSEDFNTWKKNLNVCIPLTNLKFNQMKQINTVNHKSLKKFLKAFGFEEYLI